MNNVVYIDVLILENTFMNFLLIYLLNRFCKCNAKLWKMLSAAFCGALYVIVVFFPDLHVLYSAVIKFSVSIIMIAVSFYPFSFKGFLKIIILFYIEAFTIGGAIFGIFYLTVGESGAVNGIFLINQISSKYLIFGCIIAIFGVKIGFDFFEGYYSLEKSKIIMQIVLNKKICNISALIDTANSLKDPITNKPVVIVYVGAVLDILPDDIRKVLINIKDYTLFSKAVLESSLKNKIRMIPYKALGVENGMLTALKVDSIQVKLDDKTIVVDYPLIALYSKPISEQGDYQALAYPGIIK